MKTENKDQTLQIITRSRRAKSCPVKGSICGNLYNSLFITWLLAKFVKNMSLNENKHNTSFEIDENENLQTLKLKKNPHGDP